MLHTIYFFPPRALVGRSGTNSRRQEQSTKLLVESYVTEMTMGQFYCVMKGTSTINRSRIEQCEARSVSTLELAEINSLLLHNIIYYII